MDLSPRVINITGQRFGRLIVLEPESKSPNGIVWKCRCDCGGTVSVVSTALRNKDHGTKSCGCIWKEKMTKHGHTRNGSSSRNMSPEYSVWLGMKKRCLNKNDVAYPNYGGRGISICPEWVEDFAAFLNHIGPRPSRRYSIDRYPDTNGNYEPGNVRWATVLQQARNKNNNRILTFDGESKCLGEWAEITGIPESQIRGRLRRGWSLRDALKTPIRKHKPYARRKS